MAPKAIPKKDVEITVSGGTGEAFVDINYYSPQNIVRLCSIKAPSGSSVYAFEIYDPDDFLLYKDGDFMGKSATQFSTYTCTKIKMKIINANDGVYTCRFYSEN